MKLIKNFKKTNKTKLKDICEINLGQSPSSESYTQNESDFPFFQGAADFSYKNTIIRNYTNSPKKIANKDDLLMTVRAPVGRVNFANVDCSIGRGICSFKFKDESLKDYIYFYLNNLYKKNGWNMDIQGAIFDAVNKIQIENKDITIDFKNYEKISIFLNNFENRIINYKKLLEKIEIRNNYYADKLLSGELSIDEKGNIYNNNNKEIFRTLKLDEIFNFKMGQTILNKDITIEKHSEEEVPVFSATEKNKVFGYIHISKVKFPLNENDIIISARGTIGYPKINDIKIKTSTQTTIQMISKGTVSSYIVKKIMENKKEYYFASEGAAVPQLTISTLSNKTINIVENNLSVEVFLKKLDSEKSKVEKLLELEEKRFEWLSDKLLSGEYIIED